mmetsp:Transcript_2534/g.3413  ORF Transcript_2534/g.3413 Transcript_2534/m.3413 type:complete len:432 (-) Transcript_2534:225-1520(-)
MHPQAHTHDERSAVTDGASTSELENRTHSGDEDSIGEELSWRLDPKISFSDWTIVVTPVGGKSTSSTEYHVHKNIIAVGPRRSKYFSAMLRSSSLLSEHLDSTSKISLDAKAAATFPLMLSYMYSPPNTPLELSTQYAAPLRFLASYFDVRSLLHDVNEFIRKDLTCRTAPIYIAEGDSFQDEKLIDFAVRVCSENIEGIYIGLVAALPPHLLLQVVKSPKLRCKSTWLSKIISEFCRNQPESIDGDILRELTGADLMPEIIEEEAIFLLKMCADHGLDDDEEGSLKRRCINTFASMWKEELAKPLSVSMLGIKDNRQELENNETMSSVSSSSRASALRTREKRASSKQSHNTSLRASSDRGSFVGQHFFAVYKSLPPTVQVELLESALCCAMKDVDILHQSKENEINRLHGECKAKSAFKVVEKSKLPQR